MVLANFALVTSISKEAPKLILDQIPCIYYLMQFQKEKEVIKSLLNSGSKVNAMILANARQLGF